MQTRRDQLHAYRFQNRRALAALVTGEPNELEPPMRRLTATTISGIMIAVLVAVGAIVVGLIKPSSGGAWKDAGAIIDERSTGARYVRFPNGVLHPVANYASAVLIASGSGNSIQPHIVFVDSGDIAGAPRGSLLGVPGLPDSLPAASGLAGFPWTVCSRQELGTTQYLNATVSLSVGAPEGSAGPSALAAGQSVYVQTAAGGRKYLLYAGRRLAVPNDSVASALGLSGTPLTVGTAFVDSLPAGPDLAVPTPQVTGIGQPSRTVSVNGHAVLNGQTLQVQDNGQGNQFYVVLDDGLAKLDPVQLAVFRTLRFGATQQPIDAVPVTEQTIVSTPQSSQQWSAVQGAVTGWPTTLPQVDTRTQNQRGVCAVYHSSAAPTLAVPSQAPPSGYLPSLVRESARSAGGLADSVDIGSGGAALARADSGQGTTTTAFLITAPGERYAVPTSQVLAAFGYGAVTATKIPSQLLELVRAGDPLDPTAARRPVSG